jgi:PAS domain S-box-containing protein
VAGGPPVPAGELTLRDKQGREVPVYSHHILRTTPEGKKELFCVDVDLRTLRRAEEELRRLGAAIEQSGEIVVITDSEATIQYVNPAFELVTGYAREEAVGRTPRILKSGEQDDAFYAHMWRQLSCGQTWQGRFKNKKKDGTLYTEEATISPVWSQDGQLVNYVAVKRDITRVLALEEQYRQSQKMEAIGQLTGGVAHDFNNLLQVINGGTDLALMDIEESHPARESLGEVAKAGERAAALVSQLLLFSRRQIMRPEDLNVNAVVAELLKMLRRVIGEHVFLDWIPGERLGLIHADRGMIEQVVMNLCVNARDAMSNGGTLTIETRNVFIDQDYCATHAWAEPGRYVLLQVTDTGCGMNKETLGRIFEPFFTTKQMGTGLGLATVYGIVKQHDGMISAYSEPGRGTTFKVYLPLCEQRAVDTRGDIQAPAAGGAEVILAAEDDDMVLALATRVLERAGYEVLQARNGLEAVALFERQADRIDLVLLDVVMPELGGKEAFEEMRAIRSDVKALFVSGYSDNAVHTNFVLHAGVELLQKPYAPEDLLRAVRAILGEAAEN